jgi:hypothetical protein
MHFRVIVPFQVYGLEDSHSSRNCRNLPITRIDLVHLIRISMKIRVLPDFLAIDPRPLWYPVDWSHSSLSSIQ